MRLEDIHSIYFLGIGGIGMSALARYFRKHGARVAGYDRTETDLTRRLVAEEMQIHYTDDPALLPEQVDLVVWTPAVPSDLSEKRHLEARGCPMMKRAELLGLISKSKRCVAVAGTHGKTTTSSMTAHLLRSGGIDATAFLGGIALNLQSNFVEGDSPWVVAEADEYDRSFLQLYPEVAVLNSLDPDHLDIYGSPEAVVDAYSQFVRQIKPGGILLYKHGLPIEPVVEELRRSGRRAYSFGIDGGDFRATALAIEDARQEFRLQAGAGIDADLRLRLRFPGRHNVENATAAAAVALCLGIGPEAVRDALDGFLGVRRRFEYIVNRPGHVYVDDYAHHPAEIQAVIQAARALFPGKRLTAVFQPHLYSRTRDFADGFAAALDALDVCYLLPVYPAREAPLPGVDAEMLAARMQNKNVRVLDKPALLEQLRRDLPELLLTLGAGDIDTLVGPIRNLFETSKTHPNA